MALKDVVIPTHEIRFVGGSFTVRGLSFLDITQLVAVHRSTIEPIFEKYLGRDVAPEEVIDFAVKLIGEAPVVTAHVTALAANEPDAIDVIVRLPLDVQVEALEQIARLTFELAGGPKKLVETLLRLRDMVQSLRTAGISTPR